MFEKNEQKMENSSEKNEVGILMLLLLFASCVVVSLMLTVIGEAASIGLLSYLGVVVAFFGLFFLFGAGVLALEEFKKTFRTKEDVCSN